VYWLTEDPGKIMSSDLKHEHVTPTEPLPVPAMPSTFRLAKVHGRLGVAAICDDDFVTVWVLKGESWSRRYFLEAHRARQPERGMMWWELAGPHLVHGDCFLTFASVSSSGDLLLYRHTRNEAVKSKDGVVQIRRKDHGELVMRPMDFIYQAFAYIKTKKPLSVYKH
jgi:hypothetical protein